MAGQGESCSHISSILLYVETFKRGRGKTAFTISLTWIMPSYNKDEVYAQSQNTDFGFATKVKQKLDKAVENLDDIH